MADVQKENGYTSIANELLEALVKVRLPASEKDVLFFIFRKTYGWKKKEDRISLTQFQEGTGLSRVTVIKALKNLIIRNMVVRNLTKIGVNKDYEKWTSKGVFTSKGAFTRLVKACIPKVVKAGIHTKERKKLTKENPFFNKKDSITNNSKKMKNYNENDHSDNNEVSVDYDSGEIISAKKKKEPKNKTAIKLVNIFSEMCEEYTKMKPTQNRGDYYVTLKALDSLTGEQIIEMMDDWFKSARPREELVQITHCLSTNKINIFRSKKNL